MKPTRIAIALGALFLSSVSAQAANYFDSGDVYNGTGVKLFAVGEVNGHNGFRIPAIAAAGKGVLIAAADVRYMGSGWSDIVAGTSVRETKISTKISYDGGLTWSDLNILNAKDGVADDDYMALATDPALVYDAKHDTALMFGLRNNVNLVSGDMAGQTPDKNPDSVQNIPTTQKTDFIMFTSKDKGQTWESKSIYDDILAKVNVGNTGNKYSIVFQGPGGGMSYNGKIYVPIQAWATKKDNNVNVSTSGFMVSEDGGANWEVSPMLIPNLATNTGAAARPNTSESNIFHYKGKIRLAVRHESGKADPAGNTKKLRLCYEYDEATKTWTEVEEAFIPKDVAIVETSSHNLSEDVYLVGYTSFYNYNFAGNSNRRKGQTLATNTGIKLTLSDDVSEGYTSISSDDSNIYVMYEGKIDQHDIFFKAIDWKHRDYANLNTQIRNRANKVGEISQKFASEKAYISGFYSHGGGRIIRLLRCT